MGEDWDVIFLIKENAMINTQYKINEKVPTLDSFYFYL